MFMRVCSLLLLAGLAAPMSAGAPSPHTSDSPSSNNRSSTHSSAPNLIVSLNKRLLVVREGDRTVKMFTVAVGAKKHPTPTGRFAIQHIVWNPGWVPPAEKWAKGKKPTEPGHPDNPMKVVKLFFQEPDYYIHGTDRDDSLGEAASHGCVRMSEDDVAQLARWVMDHSGAGKSEGWYAAVMSGQETSDVHLPKSVPLIVAP